MRLMRRVDRERRYGRSKGECDHVWRARDLTVAMSGARCDVCERCGVLQVVETDEPRKPVVLHRGDSALRHEGTALGSLA